MRQRLFDPSITFEEYHYYALREREYEKGISTNAGITNAFSVLVGRLQGKKAREEQMAVRTGSIVSQSGLDKELGKEAGGSSTVNGFDGVVSDEEWHTAARAARTATWGAVFYLVSQCSIVSRHRKRTDPPV